MKANKVRGARTKIKPLAEIVAIADRARRAGKIIVTTNGCFDIIHVGHVRNFESAKSLGNLLIVGVNSDVSVRFAKGSLRPIVPQAQRAEIIAALEVVDFVFIFNSKTPVGWLKKVRPSIHIKGRDWKMSEIIEKKTVEQHGGVVRLLPYAKGHSTTALIQKAGRTS